MRKIKSCFLICFIILILLPWLFFNFNVNVKSDVDNKFLQDIDWSQGNKFIMLSNYMADHIGFRDEAINTNININANLFHVMEHPSYTFGKADQIYPSLKYESVDESFIIAYVKYLAEVQKYCQARNVPFIYMINPSKTTVYDENLPSGYDYRNRFMNTMIKYLKQYGVNYVNTEYELKGKKQEEQVYNSKYDVIHWNDTGAFYATNVLLQRVQSYFPKVRLNEKDDFNISMKNQPYLGTTSYKINEDIVKYESKNSENIVSLAEYYPDLIIDKEHHQIQLYKNENGSELPRVLMFEGSYYLGFNQFLTSRFREFYGIHDYENILNFDYYYNIFQPDCVIIESAEIATSRYYYDYNKLQQKVLNPVLNVNEHYIPLKSLNYRADFKGDLVELTFNDLEDYAYNYVYIDGKAFDIVKMDGKMICTIKAEYFDKDTAKVYQY